MKRLLWSVLAGAALVSAALAQSSWQVEDTTSPVSGMHKVVVWTRSEMVPGPFSRPTAFELGIRCSPHFMDKGKYHFEVFLALGEHMTATYGCTQYKIDDGKPAQGCGTRADNYNGYFFYDPKQFLGKLLDRQTMVIEVPTYRGGVVVARFQLTGLKEKLGEIRKYCRL